jgi:hypothetical protein
MFSNQLFLVKFYVMLICAPIRLTLILLAILHLKFGASVVSVTDFYVAANIVCFIILTIIPKTFGLKASFIVTDSVSTVDFMLPLVLLLLALVLTIVTPLTNI